MYHALKLALSPSVVRRSLKVALIVGTLIGLINYFDKVATGTMTPGDWIKALVTYCVPFLVSTYAAVSAILAMEREARSSGT
ncbi:MAG: hypothetical protein FJX29_08835 [Alphaproteobacteria bacterium]|nr:hypothetical protein [Alphaproteobacteria bacterium]